MQHRDLQRYDYLPWNARPRIQWPGGARVALWVAPNVEFYELAPPANPSRAAWARPQPDVLHYAIRDYGNRVGFWRLLECMDRHGVRGSVSLNAAACDHHPEIIAACARRGWEFFSHGLYNTRYHYGMDESQERGAILDAIETIRRHTGQTPEGWLAPALTHTSRTLDLVAECGLRYICDLFHDDQPGPVKVRTGHLTSIPYSLETNDLIAHQVQLMTPRRYAEVIRRQFHRLYEEGAHSGTVMCIPLHPYLIGQPYRLAAFEEALAHIAAHDKVWMTTGREIARHFDAHYRDAFAAAGQAIEEVP